MSPHLPAAGELVLFDRSWYNRAGVEKVMGFAHRRTGQGLPATGASCSKSSWSTTASCCSSTGCAATRHKQEKRFAERFADPLKRWKLSPIDVEARKKYADYTRAREAMLKATHTKHAPWTLVDFNDQRRGRLTLIRDLLDRLPDTRVPGPMLEFAPLAGKPARERYGVLKPIAPFRGD